MRIAITGATGFIGARLAYELRAVHTLIPLARAAMHDEPSFDLAQPADLHQKLERMHADVIIHAGAMARRRECDAWPALAHTINVNATAVVSAWAAARGIPMVFLSTIGVYEDNVYANTKRMAESYVQRSGAKACILRLAYTFGWSPSFSRPAPQQRLEAEAAAPGSQAFDNSWKFQPTSLTHLCRVLEAILTRIDTPPPMITVATPCLTTMHELASSCLPHKICASTELSGRNQNHIAPQGLEAEGVPTHTMKDLLNELRTLMQNRQSPVCQ